MDPESPGFEHTWTARRVRPVTAVYVVAVFLAFMALAFFVFDSMDAVKALGGTALAALVSMAPGLLSRVQYRLTDSGLGKRPFKPKAPGEFKELFSWDELSHVVPTGTGFKFYKIVEPSGAIRRFMKRHVLAGYSGEFHVEDQDVADVRALLEERKIPISRPSVWDRLGDGSGS